jgi:hypothetical protein
VTAAQSVASLVILSTAKDLLMLMNQSRGKADSSSLAPQNAIASFFNRLSGL